jgi:hypothetical protein
MSAMGREGSSATECGRRLREILAGKPAFTADRNLRLCRFFELSDGWWLGQQAAYDGREGGSRKDARECEIVEGSRGADGGCVLMRLYPCRSVVTVKQLPQRIDATTR